MKTPQLIHSQSPVRTLLHIETHAPPTDNSPSPGLPVEALSAKAGAEGRGEGGTAVSQTGPGASALDAGPSTAVLDFISSTATVDRYHEIIDPAGWHLDSYRCNPVFQNAHQYGDILFTLGKALITEVRTSPREAPNKLSTISSQPSIALYQRIQFATDVNPMARIAYGLYRGKFLNAVSVGFVPLRWENGPEGGSYKRKYVEQELLEVSAVAIPANPNALALAVKSGAVTKSDLADTLDLLRRLTIDYGPWHPPSLSQITQLSTLNPQLLNLARELRRILRRA